MFGWRVGRIGCDVGNRPLFGSDLADAVSGTFTRSADSGQKPCLPDAFRMMADFGKFTYGRCSTPISTEKLFDSVA